MGNLLAVLYVSWLSSYPKKSTIAVIDKLIDRAVWKMFNVSEKPAVK
jgi:hypothetical protein